MGQSLLGANVSRCRLCGSGCVVLNFDGGKRFAIVIPVLGSCCVETLACPTFDCD
jgi:hypothetical protein